MVSMISFVVKNEDQPQIELMDILDLIHPN